MSRSTWFAAALGTPLLGLFMSVACGTPKPAVSPEASNSAPTVEPKKDALVMPGECVDPVADGDHHDPTRPTDKHVQPDVRNEDLDDDGVPDIFVKPGWSCGVRCYRSVYISRGKCAHYVGTFVSDDDYSVLPETSHGLHDLQVKPGRNEEDGGMHCYRVVLKFDGTDYKPFKHRECKCDAPNMCTEAWEEGGP